MEIKVTQKHINNGKQGNTKTCAIALALSEEFPGADVSVSPSEIKVAKENGFSFSFTWTDIPKKIESFIYRFDKDRKKAKPFSFKLPF